MPPPQGPRREMNQPALGSWLLDHKGREMLASVFLLSSFIFATDLVSTDRETEDLDAGSKSSIPALSQVSLPHQHPVHASHCTASQLYVSITHCKYSGLELNAIVL